MSRLYSAVLSGFLLGIAGAVLSFFHFAHQIEEDVGLGLLFKLRGVRKAPTEVVVVSVDRESSERLNVAPNPDKWPRSLHAALVESLARQGAEIIVFDLYFVEPSSANEDNSLAEAIRKARNVVIAERLEAQAVPSTGFNDSHVGTHKIVKVVEPIAPLAQSAAATAPFVLPRIPTKLSNYWAFQPAAGDSPTFPVVAFQLYALHAYEDFVRLLEKASPNQAGKLPRNAEVAIEARGALRFIRDIREVFKSDLLIAKTMARDLNDSSLLTTDVKKYTLLKSLINLYGGTNRRYLNYYGPPRTLKTVPFYRIVQIDDEIDLKGKAVFVGLSEIVLRERDDSYHTVFSQEDGVFISGVEIAATAFANLLEDTPVKPINFQYYILIILAWGILVLVVCRIATTGIAACAVFGVSLVYLFAAEYAFKTASMWYPVVIPLFLQAPLGFFGAVLWKHFETNKERQQMRKALRYYVPDEVVDQLATNIVDIKRAGEALDGTCLLTDAAGYTKLSETMSARELSEFMRRYFEATFDPIKRNGGLVVDLTGDSIVAVWKSARPETRKQACLAALGVVKAVRQFNESVGTLQLPTRLGVHAGQIFLGNIGAWDHYEYGATGDTVNTASRMDSLNKYLRTEVLVSEDVIHDLRDFLTREVGKFLFKGKAQPVTVHELLCRIEESRQNQRKGCVAFSEGLKAFRRQHWDEAKDKFKQCIEYLGPDGPSDFYFQLCEQYKENPPAWPWDGVILLGEK